MEQTTKAGKSERPPHCTLPIDRDCHWKCLNPSLETTTTFTISKFSSKKLQLPQKNQIQLWKNYSSMQTQGLIQIVFEKPVTTMKSMLLFVLTNETEIWTEMNFDQELQHERYHVEPANAQMDSYRSLLKRFDTNLESQKEFNLLAFIVRTLKKFKKKIIKKV